MGIHHWSLICLQTISYIGNTHILAFNQSVNTLIIWHQWTTLDQRWVIYSIVLFLSIYYHYHYYCYYHIIIIIIIITIVIIIIICYYHYHYNHCYYHYYYFQLYTCCAKMDVVHYRDVIMGVTASQITSLTIVFSTVYSDADQRKHQSSASLAFVRGIHRRPVNSPTNGQLGGKCFIWWRHHGFSINSNKTGEPVSLMLTYDRTI